MAQRNIQIHPQRLEQILYEIRHCASSAQIAAIMLAVADSLEFFAESEVGDD